MLVFVHVYNAHEQLMFFTAFSDGIFSIVATLLVLDLA